MFWTGENTTGEATHPMIEVELSEIGGSWSVERISLTTTAGNTIHRLRGTDWTARAGVPCLAAVLAILKLRNPKGDAHPLDARLSQAENKLGTQFQKLWNAPNHSGSIHWTVNVLAGFPSDVGHNTSPMERFLYLHGSAKNLQVGLKGPQGQDLRFRLDGREMSPAELQRFLTAKFKFEFGSDNGAVARASAEEVATVAKGAIPENDDMVRPLHAAPEISGPASPVPPDLQIEIAKINKQISEIRSQPRNADGYRRELHQLRTLGTMLTGCKGYAAPEVEAVYEAIRRIWRQAQDPEEYLPAAWALCRYHLLRGELRESAEAGQQLLEHARDKEYPEAFAYAHTALLAASVYQANMSTAMQHWEAAWELHAAFAFRPRYRTLYDANATVTWLAYVALLHWASGRVGYASACADSAIRLARDLEEPGSMAQALYFAARLQHLTGACAKSQSLALQVMQLAQETRLPVWWAEAAVVYGDSRSVEGHHKEGLRWIGEGIDACRRIGARISMPYFFIVKARALARAGQLKRASDTAASALAAIRQMGCTLHESEALSLHAELLHGASPANNPDAANGHRQAIECASVQGAHSLALRARLAFAKYLISSNALDEVPLLLSDGLAPFREQEESPDIIEARQLLASM